MTLIEFAAVPYTAEYFLATTSVVFALTTGNYFPSTGVCRSSMADRAFISVETANMRYKINGSAPATACGHLLVAGDYLVLDDPAQIANFQMLNEAGTATAYVYVTYFGG